MSRIPDNIRNKYLSLALLLLLYLSATALISLAISGNVYAAIETGATAAESVALSAENTNSRIPFPAPNLKREDYPRMGVSSRSIVWVVAQMHLFFAAFVLAVPIFVLVIEWIGVRTGDERYDDMAHECMKISMTAYSITALFGGALLFAQFLLVLNDRTDSRPGEEVSEGIQDKELTLHPDALALQFPKLDAFQTSPVVVKPLYRHGDKNHATTIWYWNAGSVEPPIPASATLIDANGPDQKLKFREAGDLKAAGAWNRGQWKVMFTRPRKIRDGGDVSFDEGRFIPISFANWDGSNGEAGSKHTLTTWYWLILPPQANLTYITGIPLLMIILSIMAGLIAVRPQRKQALQQDV